MFPAVWLWMVPGLAVELPARVCCGVVSGWRVGVFMFYTCRFSRLWLSCALGGVWWRRRTAWLTALLWGVFVGLFPVCFVWGKVYIVLLCYVVIGGRCMTRYIVVYVRPGRYDEFEVWYPKGFMAKSLDEFDERYSLLLKITLNVKEELRVYVE